MSIIDLTKHFKRNGGFCGEWYQCNHCDTAIDVTKDSELDHEQKILHLEQEHPEKLQ